MDNLSRKVWVAVNKNGFIMTFINQPQRNVETGKWEGNVYVDSFVYKIVSNIVEKANLTWENEPEFFEFGSKSN